jgi:hypothetical protein
VVQISTREKYFHFLLSTIFVFSETLMVDAVSTITVGYYGRLKPKIANLYEEGPSQMY